VFAEEKTQMKAEDMIGTHDLVLGTVQDIMDVFKQMTPKTRGDSYVRLVVGDDVYDVRSIQCAQSDQHEKHELKVYIKATEQFHAGSK
jgi:hypothetical protein